MVRKTAKSTEDSPASNFNWDLMLKVVGALVAIAGVAFGVYQYTQKKTETNDARKYEQYTKATQVAASFAKASTKQEALDLSKQFWTIYNGDLSIVEDENVKQAMQNFGGAVRQWEKYNSGGSDFSPPSIFELEDKQGNAQTFDQLAYELSQACRQSLEK